MRIDLILAAPPRYREAAIRGKPFKTYTPQTLNVLAGNIPEGHVIRIVDQNIIPVDENTDAELALISANTCSVEEAYRLSSVFRERGIKTVIGGSHATVMPDEVQKYADSAAIGPGDNIISDIIEDAGKELMKNVYNGFEKPLRVSRKFRAKRDKRYFPADTIEITRGCPNKCSFCAISSMNNDNVYCMSIREALAEIEQSGKIVLFLDSNPMENRDYFIRLMKNMAGMRKQWAAACTFRIASDREMMALAMKSGCIGLLIGIESVNSRSLESVNKHFNNAEKYAETVKYLHDAGIGVLGTFVLGLDYDDANVFEKTFEFVNKAKIDIVKYGIMTPMPGTDLFRKLENEDRILTREWSKYDTESVVFRPKGMTIEQLSEGFREINRRTYSYKSICRRINSSMKLLHIAVAGNLAFRHFAKDI